MRVYGEGTETFLFLNGISVDQPLELGAGITLRPASVTRSQDEMRKLGETETDAALIALFLPLVAAELQVTGTTGEEVARKAWNSLWDTVLLSAICNAGVMHIFQSSVSAKELSNDSKLQIVHHNLHGCHLEPAAKISEKDVDWITANFASARCLMEKDSYRNAVHCCATYSWHSMPAVQLAILWSGIEGIFKVENELSFRVSLYAVSFLFPGDREKQREMFKVAKKLYGLRSKAVHGGKADPDELDYAVASSFGLLRQLVLKCAEIGSLPVTHELIP